MCTHYWIDDPWHLDYEEHFIDWIKDNVTECQDENLHPGDTTEMDAFLAGFNNENE